jgi:methionine sulfoxide reductase heme-binding subunit
LTRFLRSTWFPVFLHTAALTPLIILVVDLLIGRLGANPVQAMEVRSGRIAISLLTATLAVSPMAGFLKQPALRKARRPLGLYTFMYICLHLLALVGFDYAFNIPQVATAYLGKPFIWFGLLTGVILAALALTSFSRSKQTLGGWWGRLHRLIYLAALLDLAHYFLAVKGNLFSFSGNLARPLAYCVVITGLLIVRILQRIHPATSTL